VQKKAARAANWFGHGFPVHQRSNFPGKSETPIKKMAPIRAGHRFEEINGVNAIAGFAQTDNNTNPCGRSCNASRRNYPSSLQTCCCIRCKPDEFSARSRSPRDDQQTAPSRKSQKVQTAPEPPALSFVIAVSRSCRKFYHDAQCQPAVSATRPQRT
jgi:hypothetical protein